MFRDGADLPNESRHKGPIMMVKGGAAYEMEEIMLLRLRPQWFPPALPGRKLVWARAFALGPLGNGVRRFVLYSYIRRRCTCSSDRLALMFPKRDDDYLQPTAVTGVGIMGQRPKWNWSTCILEPLSNISFFISNFQIVLPKKAAWNKARFLTVPHTMLT
jgi:hypothetical protein